MEGEELRVLLYLTSYSMNRSMNRFSFFQDTLSCHPLSPFFLPILGGDCGGGRK